MQHKNPESFAAAAAALDEIEELAEGRRGGPTQAMSSKIIRCEEEVGRHTPVFRDDWQWLARRLARALSNEWTKEAADPLVRMAIG